jgi:anaerobic C4-dicarboxylate transporter
MMMMDDEEEMRMTMGLMMRAKMMKMMMMMMMEEGHAKGASADDDEELDSKMPAADSHKCKRDDSTSEEELRQTKMTMKILLQAALLGLAIHLLFSLPPLLSKHLSMLLSRSMMPMMLQQFRMSWLLQPTQKVGHSKVAMNQ